MALRYQHNRNLNSWRSGLISSEKYKSVGNWPNEEELKGGLEEKCSKVCLEALILISVSLFMLIT